MRIPILTFGAIASVLTINSVIADTTVTSKQYVDAEVAKKQDIIESAMVNSGTVPNRPWEDELTSVASYDDENGLVANEYGILTQELIDNAEMMMSNYFGELAYGSPELANADKAVPTVAAVAVEFESLYDFKQNKMTCAGWPDGVAQTDENCWLWDKN